MTHVSRNVVTIIGLAALVVLCPVALLAYFVWDTPAYRLELEGTEWTVASVDGVRVADPRPVLSFSNAAGFYRTPCGDLTLAYDMDTDGSALSVWQPEGGVCESMTEAERAVMDAVLGAEEWSYQDDNHITLVGPHRVGLAR
jgi:hypothetical protein